MGIKSYEAAVALPLKNTYDVKTIKRGGRLVYVPMFREIIAQNIEDDDIMCFIEDGKRMSIGYDKDGAYKYEV